MSRKIFAIVAVLIIMVSAYIILTDDTLFVEDKNIVLVGYSKYSQKWIDVKEGALSAGQKQDVNITAAACDSILAVSDQILFIEQAIDDKVDAIIIMPTDLEQLSSTIEKVYHNNIDLIIIDNYQQIEEFAIPRVGTSDVKIAEDLAKDISQSKEGEIKIGCIFSYDNNGKSSSIYSAFTDSVKQYKNIKIAAETTSAIDENVAGAAAEVMLKSYDLDYVVCFEEIITKGACDYLSKEMENEEDKLFDGVQIIGIGSVDECARYLEDEIIYSLGVQSYYNMGYLAVQNYAEVLFSDVYSAHYIIHKEDLDNEEYQKILFRIN